MTDTSKKELMNEAYDAVLVTVGVVVLSMASEKLLGEKIPGTTTIKGGAKLAAGIAISSMLVKYAQDKKWISDDPF